MSLIAEELLTRASARGIDLKVVAGSSSEIHGLARKRPRTREEIRLGLDVKLTSVGHSTRTYRKPHWHVGEAGQDIPRVPWLAALYSIAGDEAPYWELWTELNAAAGQMAKRQGWAPRVRDISGTPMFYLPRMAQMVLDQEAHAYEFTKAPLLPLVYMNVSEPVWTRNLSSRYHALQDRYQTWLGIAKGYIRRWIDDEPNDSQKPTA